MMQFALNLKSVLGAKARCRVRCTACTGIAAVILSACIADEPSSGVLVGPVGGAQSQVAAEDTSTYLVLLNVHRSNADAVARDIVAKERARQRYLYRSLSGLAISGIDEAAAARIAQDPRVRLVERDQKASLSGDQVLPAGGAGGPLWALDRIDVFGPPNV